MGSQPIMASTSPVRMSVSASAKPLHSLRMTGFLATRNALISFNSSAPSAKGSLMPRARAAMGSPNCGSSRSAMRPL